MGDVIDLTVAPIPVWEWFDDDQGWQPYVPADSAILEGYYTSDSKGRFDVTFTHPAIRDNDYSVCFVRMTQYNKRTAGPRPIRRTDSEGGDSKPATAEEKEVPPKKKQKVDSAARVHVYGDVQGYVAVPTKYFRAILDEGYKCSAGDAVPFSTDRTSAVEAMRRAHPDVHDSHVLEIHNVPWDMIQGTWVMTKHLLPEFLKSGEFMTRVDNTAAPCPCCNGAIPHDAVGRGRIGLARYVDGAFMCTPCSKPGCVGMMTERQQRLNDRSNWVTLYHQTDQDSSNLIYKAGGKMIRGSSGVIGGGIYCCTSLEDTNKKALHKGVLLKCTGKVGRRLETGAHDHTKYTFADLIKKGYDSLYSNAGYQKHDKHYVIYSWDQIQVICRVQYDGTEIPNPDPLAVADLESD